MAVPKKKKVKAERKAESIKTQGIKTKGIKTGGVKTKGVKAVVCCCSVSPAENKVRDIINLMNVYKSEEVEGVSTKIEPDTAEELVAELEELAELIGQACVCK
ncbi:MAG: hypothetical protein AB1668_03265 [Nanoarchaeota archaeon]